MILECASQPSSHFSYGFSTFSFSSSGGKDLVSVDSSIRLLLGPLKLMMWIMKKACRMWSVQSILGFLTSISIYQLRFRNVRELNSVGGRS